MKIIDLKNDKCIKKIQEPLCLLLGNFDGVHEGHTRLIDVALEEGRDLGIKVAVWTFAEHPLNVMGKGVPTLSSNEEKNSLFAEKGIDYVIYEDFAKVKNTEPADFINNILIGQFDCRAVVCGFNFKFGKNGGGKPDLLLEEMKKQNRRVAIVPPVYRMDKVVSSTEIRTYLENGDVENAAIMLGRPYSIELPVEYGNAVGRTLGLPTINQHFPKNRIKPCAGSYACKCYVGQKEYYGVANVGSRPTVNSDKSDINCETHIIGFNGWIYGEKVKVEFYKKLRDERRFDNVSELKSAIESDKEETVRYFDLVNKRI